MIAILPVFTGADWNQFAGSLQGWVDVPSSAYDEDFPFDYQVGDPCIALEDESMHAALGEITDIRYDTSTGIPRVRFVKVRLTNKEEEN